MNKDDNGFIIDTATKQTNQVEINSKLTSGFFTKGANKGNAPKASDINNMIQNVSQKEGE